MLTHTAEYWGKLLNQTLSPKEIRKIGFPMSPLLVERGRHIAHATYECALSALQYGIALNIAGVPIIPFQDMVKDFVFSMTWQ